LPKYLEVSKEIQSNIFEKVKDIIIPILTLFFNF